MESLVSELKTEASLGIQFSIHNHDFQTMKFIFILVLSLDTELESHREHWRSFHSKSQVFL